MTYNILQEILLGIGFAPGIAVGHFVPAGRVPTLVVVAVLGKF